MNNPIYLTTIGLNQKNAEDFFETLIKARVKRVIDTRLHGAYQLEEFSGKPNLKYLLQKIGGIDYVARGELVPTKEILIPYQNCEEDWQTYKEKYLNLISDRKIEKTIPPILLNHSCLLGSEAKPHYSHPRLVAEYLSEKWGNIKIRHL